MKNFAMTGVGGFIAVKHLKSIRDTGNVLVAAVDPSDSVGILDSFFPEARFFTEPERFERFLEKRRLQGEEQRIHYMSICSPNYLHDAHIRMALREKAHVICEKPLVINPWNLNPLAELEAETGYRVFTVLQLRLHPPLIELKQKLETQYKQQRASVELTYITRRGHWYDISWKGSEEKSGGVAMNIGIHFFDLLLWLFGPLEKSAVHLRDKRRMAGTLELERASVRWFLSVDWDDIPAHHRQSGKYAYRSITVDGEEVEFSEGFGDLHTRVYENVLTGNGFGIADARPSIELVYAVRNDELVIPSSQATHPFLIR
jgi:UDP-N-acetyl-2-amino-2-deoxyglucuronate dehydrogenase